MLDKYTKELFDLINKATNDFIELHPDFNKAEVSFNAVTMFGATLVNLLMKGEPLKKKFKLLDELIKKEKEWVRYEHNRDTK